MSQHGDITLTAEDYAATVSDTSSSATITIDSAASLTADNFVASAASYFDGGESAGGVSHLPMLSLPMTTQLDPIVLASISMVI